MFYSVHKDGKLLHYGECLNEAAQAIEKHAEGGVEFLSAPTSDELKAKLEAAGVRVPCCGCTCHDEQLVEDLKALAEEGLKTVREGVDYALDKLGVSKEDVNDFLGRVKDRGQKAAEDTRDLGVKGANLLGDVFQAVADRLKQVK